jgi:hypothetical protein
MAAPALFAAQAGLKTFQGIQQAYQMKAMAELKLEALDMQTAEMQARTRMQIDKIHQRSDQIRSEQEAAFVKSGVTMSGSAMSVVSDTLSQAAEAAYIRQRETNYDIMSLAGEKAAAKSAASNSQLLFNIATSAAGGVQTYFESMKNYNQARSLQRGAGDIDYAGMRSSGKSISDATQNYGGLGDAYA